jgi:large subunit ribosomal protein L30|tara:strand:+ start:272 stop:466 length:195 start_codon:yes stop_codon:yes gene_type:complete
MVNNMSKIKITQIKSFIKKPKNQKLTLKALGLKKIGQSIIHEKSNVIDGMIEKVKHLIKVEKIQ